jgi:hypothetical protein
MAVEDAWSRTLLEYTEFDRCTSSCELVLTARHYSFSVIIMFLYLCAATLHLATKLDRTQVDQRTLFVSIITSNYAQEKGAYKECR